MLRPNAIQFTDDDVLYIEAIRRELLVIREIPLLEIPPYYE